MSDDAEVKVLRHVIAQLKRDLAQRDREIEAFKVVLKDRWNPAAMQNAVKNMRAVSLPTDEQLHEGKW